MLSDSMPSVSARSMAASSTRSRLKGVRGSVLWPVRVATLSTLSSQPSVHRKPRAGTALRYPTLEQPGGRHGAAVPCTLARVVVATRVRGGTADAATIRGGAGVCPADGADVEEGAAAHV